MRSTTLVLLSGTLGGCLVEKGTVDDGLVPVAVQGAFEKNCAVTGCHDTVTRAANLSLAKGDIGDIVDAPSSSELPLVEVGDLYGSYLALKLLGDPSITGEQMPLGGIDDDAYGEISLILSWIAGLEVPDDVRPLRPPSELTFTDHVWPVLEARCSCHDSDAGTAGLVMQEGNAYVNIVDVAASGSQDGLSYVDSMNGSAESYIWFKITGALQSGEGGRMPPGGAGNALDGYELQIIRDWIEQGAPE